MKRILWVRAALAALLACAALPGIAQAQYYYTVNVTQTGPATCGPAFISVPATGTVSINLPNTPNNAYIRYTITGDGPVSGFESAPGPFPATEAITDPLKFLLPSAHAQPYTIEQTVQPASNGVLTGTGARIRATCNADNTATFAVQNGLSADPVQVPLLPPAGLALLAALLALLGTGALRVPRTQRC